MISETKAVIRNAATAMGDLIQYIQDISENNDERSAIDEFLKSPSARGWERTRWVIDSIIQQAIAANDKETMKRAEKWESLKNLSSPVVAASIYDIEPKNVKGTPLQNLAQSKAVRDKYKLALGPAGYVATLSNVGKITQSKLKDMLKTIAASGPAIAKAAKQDIPDIRTIQRF